MMKEIVTVNCVDGLDARPIAMLVQKASQFASVIHIEVGNKKVNAKSIMGMMSLNVASGDEVTVIAQGEDEEAALREIRLYLSGSQK